eukprot:14539178-Alexandrium_andersonii.AAC.1
MARASTAHGARRLQSWRNTSISTPQWGGGDEHCMAGIVLGEGVGHGIGRSFDTCILKEVGKVVMFRVKSGGYRCIRSK